MRDEILGYGDQILKKGRLMIKFKMTKIRV